MITSYEIPVGPSRSRLIQTIEYRREYRGGAPAAVTYTWRGEYRDGTWLFHPIQQKRVQDGCGGGNSKPQLAPDGHMKRVLRECRREDVDVHLSCPLYCSDCGGRLADSVYAQEA